MTPVSLVFTIIAAFTLFGLPRRWAALPLLAGTCYATLSQGIELGPFRFTIIRLLVVVGLIRAALRSERPVGGLNGLDKILLVWSGWALISSAFHTPPMEAFVNRMGLVYNTLGIYFLIRTFCHTLDDATNLITLLAILLFPLALEMIYEKMTGRNLFGLMSGGIGRVVVRNDELRAQGPFGHPILAGTVGAVCLPLMIGIWRRNQRLAKLGVAGCVIIILASSSSGPLLSAIGALLAVVFWHWRHLTSIMRRAFVVVYIMLDLVMQAPAYYLVARIDLTGGSTGWHRAYLIETSMKHFSEWWLAGTDYTRHWMPTGVSWSEDHCDITNHYLFYGVAGGLPLMALFILALCVAFAKVGRGMRALTDRQDQFLVWCIGAGLFAHATTSLSVAYFDQTFLFLYCNIALAASQAATGSLTISKSQQGDINLVISAEPNDNTGKPALPEPA